jgi:SAM-dependent methyltransferase
MTRPPAILADSQKEHLLLTYGRTYPVAPLSYGTVRDYCDSCTALPRLSALQGDLKDQQRPWTLKALLGLLPPGANLLEIGAGEPFTAQMLAELGYYVTVIDPYDGSGNGPTEYEKYLREYPGVTIVRDALSADTAALQSQQFDCIYSISVLEHIHEPALTSAFQGIGRHLKPGGVSLHAIDFVVSGHGADFHTLQVSRILDCQASLAGTRPPELSLLIETLKQDDDTYYLSASGHNLWRGNTPYDEFPFRKVVSIQSFVYRA